MRWITVATAIVLSSSAGIAGADLTPGQKCEANKLRFAGMYSLCRMVAEAKAVRKNLPPDYDKCDAKLHTRWTKAETKAAGACPLTGDLSQTQSRVRVDTNQLTLAIAADARFTDNADGTITDHQTGLMWEKKVALDDSPNEANLNDADNRYSWSGRCSISFANCQPNSAAAAACGAEAGCAECGVGEGTCIAPSHDTIWEWLVQLNGANFAGHSDWRIPSRDELLSIVTYDLPTEPAVDSALHAATCSGACMELADPACSCTQAWDYWSASAYVLMPHHEMAWAVFFRDGRVAMDEKGNSNLFVRAVRGGS